MKLYLNRKEYRLEASSNVSSSKLQFTTYLTLQSPQICWLFVSGVDQFNTYDFFLVFFPRYTILGHVSADNILMNTSRSTNCITVKSD